MASAAAAAEQSGEQTRNFLQVFILSNHWVTGFIPSGETQLAADTANSISSLSLKKNKMSF